MATYSNMGKGVAQINKMLQSGWLVTRVEVFKHPFRAEDKIYRMILAKVNKYKYFQFLIK